jgi:hypothetical protein
MILPLISEFPFPLLPVFVDKRALELHTGFSVSDEPGFNRREFEITAAPVPA